MLVVMTCDGSIRLRCGPHVAQADLAQHIGSGDCYGIQEKVGFATQYYTNTSPAVAGSCGTLTAADALWTTKW